MVRGLNRLIVQHSLTFTMALCWPGSAHAFDNYNFTANTQLLSSQYRDALSKESLSTQGLSLAADHLDRWQLSLGYNRTTVEFSEGINPTNQRELVAKWRHTFFKNAPGGKLNNQVSLYRIDNDDPTGNTDNVNALHWRLSHLNASSDLYLDTAFSFSSYPQDLTVWQWSPTVGLSLPWFSAQWFQLRFYAITPSEATLAQNYTRTTAFDVQWTRWLSPSSNWLWPHSIQLGLLGGTRMYAVDDDATSVYNNSAAQTGSLTVTVSWQLTDHTQLILNGGQANYTEDDTTTNTKNDFNSRHLYLNLSHSW